MSKKPKSTTTWRWKMVDYGHRQGKWYVIVAIIPSVGPRSYVRMFDKCYKGVLRRAFAKYPQLECREEWISYLEPEKNDAEETTCIAGPEPGAGCARCESRDDQGQGG